MSFQQQFETELDLLEQEFEADDMTPAEYRAAMRELEEDYRSAAYEAAETAYDEELGRW